MTDWRTELRLTWATVGAAAAGEAVSSLRLTEGPRPIRVFVDADGARHLLVPGDRRAEEDIAVGPALRYRIRSLDFGAGQETFLDLACRSPALFEVFDELLVSVIVSALASGDPLGSAMTMLERWHELLLAWVTSLGHEREMGLFAELAVLEMVTAANGVFDPMVWRGPMHEPKDLVFPLAWVEVKAVGANSRTVTINGLEQLADVPGSAGYLAVLTLVGDDDGRTVKQLVDLLAPRSSDPLAFGDHLVAAGWVEHPDARRWRVDGIDVVRADLCPRLTPQSVGTVPAGVGLVRYQLDLPVVRSMRVPDGVSVLRAVGSGR